MIGNIDNFASDDAITVPSTFKIREVDGLTSAAPEIGLDALAAFSTYSNQPKANGVAEAPPPVPGKFNVLSKLKGKFRGAGLNMIFRPSYGNNRRDNVLEYNVTEEVTQFLPDIGDVPNRGLGKQRDVIIKAVPYTQMITDLLNPDTGNPDRKDPIPIHFENGIFLRTPATDFRPVIQHGTISRLASIPHGTVINIQGFEPDIEKPTPGKPDIQPVSIVPFPAGAPTDLITFDNFFPQLNLKRPMNLRIPREIKPGGFLTETLMLNPNELLNDHNESSTKKTIKDHLSFSLTSEGTNDLPGGGTANSGFLAGPGEGKAQQNQGPNADGATVRCDYWISTVLYDVLLPEGDYSGDKAQKVVVDSEARKEEKAAGKVVISPKFKVELNKKIPKDTVVKLEATQIQYSQFVVLNFDTMGWPHVSVATLSPLKAVPVCASEVIF